MPEIHVLIAAYGPEAAEKIASLSHASVSGVDYTIGWQNHDMRRVPERLLARKDFKILRQDTRGLCNNRNALMNTVSKGIAVIADDDLAYHENHFLNIVRGVEENPDCHLLLFRYASEVCPKRYPAASFDLNGEVPKGYFVTSMEMVFNLDKIAEDFGGTDDILFNPAFGVNGTAFGCGEEDILIARLLRKGYKVRFVPSDICLNTESTTSERISGTQGFIETRGAVMSYVHPSTWFLRMLTHAWRDETQALRYCRWWIRGWRKARRLGVFRNY